MPPTARHPGKGQNLNIDYANKNTELIILFLQCEQKIPFFVALVTSPPPHPIPPHPFQKEK